MKETDLAVQGENSRRRVRQSFAEIDEELERNDKLIQQNPPAKRAVGQLNRETQFVFYPVRRSSKRDVWAPDERWTGVVKLLVTVPNEGSVVEGKESEPVRVQRDTDLVKFIWQNKAGERHTFTVHDRWSLYGYETEHHREDVISGEAVRRTTYIGFSRPIR